MKTILLSALALGALTSAAVAEPVALSDAQLDGVTAGRFQINWAEVNALNLAIAANVDSPFATAVAAAVQEISVDQEND
jgi:hypothetical protein